MRSAEWARPLISSLVRGSSKCGSETVVYVCNEYTVWSRFPSAIVVIGCREETRLDALYLGIYVEDALICTLLLY